MAGITALRCGRLLVVANAALNLQPKTLFLKKKNTLKATCEKTWTITLWRTWTISCLRNSQQWKRKLMQLLKFHPLRLMLQPHRFKLAQKSKLTWFAKNPGRVAAGKILEEYNHLYIYNGERHQCQADSSLCNRTFFTSLFSTTSPYLRFIQRKSERKSSSWSFRP